MIETERLYIRPLKADELIRHFQSPDEFGKSLNLTPSTSLLDEEVREAMINSFIPNLKDETKDYRFHTMWILIEKHHKAIIGGICFHGEPNSAGEAEIGYGTDPEYQSKGYMTETISGIIGWAKENTKIKTLIAETALSNTPSIRVLEKCNFKIREHREENIILELDLKHQG